MDEEVTGSDDQYSHQIGPQPELSDVTDNSGPVLGKGQMIQGRFALLVVALMVILADFTVYKSQGFAGLAIFLSGASVLVFVGIPSRSIRFCTVLVWAMLAYAAYRIACHGNGLLIVCGFWLLVGLAVALRGKTPFLLATLGFAAECFPVGFEFFTRLNDRLRARVLTPVDEGKPLFVAEIAFPLISLILFGGVFVMANPDMVNLVSGTLGEFADMVWEFAFQFSPFEVVFWGVVALLTGGLLRPVVVPVLASAIDVGRSQEVAEAPLYSAFRNTLLTLIALFSIYLMFESRAFVSRKPPEGFTYSSYAHEGAAWLTVALGMATVTLSLIFRGRTLREPRLRRLQKLAWVWTSLNFALAIAVYNRMLIYIDFNGMTRMRTVALLGISSVVAGFLLVVFKIQRQQSFGWLVRRQMWVLGFAIYLYSVLPVDVLIHRYNVNQILGGNPAPIVQVTAHKVHDEALPVLLPLCNVKDEMVAKGVQSMLSSRFGAIRQDLQASNELGWTAWQRYRGHTVASLESARTGWDTFDSNQKKIEAWSRLKDFAFQNWW